jgi:cytochrome c oxidase accessory protein FixG
MVFVLLPWLVIEGRPAILFDLPARKFHILWLTFWPQDFVLLAWGMMVAAFALFFFTTWLGRVWCGYACPQTIWSAIYTWAERLMEGDRNQRMRLDQAPASPGKFARRAVKHGLWLLIAFATSLTFIGYFYDVRDLVIDLVTVNVSSEPLFWLLLFTVLTYINAGWMREQVCLYICPYARFQSAMFDADTLIVSYDEARGEQRGSRKRGSPTRGSPTKGSLEKGVPPADTGLGDCIDCQQCVQVCPTGIDIRDGLQYECINCALCIDACDNIMDKMDYKRGLIAYTTENRLAGLPRRVLRPKFIGYGAAMVTMLCLFLALLIYRVPLELDVIRDRGRLYEVMLDGRIQNIYTLKILNMSRDAHSFRISVGGLREAELGITEVVAVAPGEIRNLPTTVRIAAGNLQGPISDISFRAEAIDAPDFVAESESRFIAP